MKPEPPPYPRPVPNIDFDEDPILPGTIVYTNGDELDENARAAKRRRIEANANAYLRGEGLFILSAGLRGPFDAGWKNPWAPKSKKRKLASDSQSHANKRPRVISDDQKLAQIVNPAVPYNRPRQSLPVQENPFARTIRSSETPSHEEKVASWLRRNSALPQGSFIVPTSPTPKKRTSLPGSSKVTKPTWTPTKQRIVVNSQDIRAPSYHVTSRVPDSFDTVVPPGQQPVETHEKLQNALHARDPAQVPRQGNEQDAGRPSAITKDFEAPVRAEQAIMNLKRRSEEPVHGDKGMLAAAQEATPGINNHLVPDQESENAAENASTTMKHLGTLTENRVAAEPSVHKLPEHSMPDGSAVEPEVKLKELDASVDEQLKSHHDVASETRGEEAEHSAVKVMGAPVPSTAVSEFYSVRLPPSAQHKLELQTSASNMSSAALLPDVANDKRTATLVTLQSNVSEQVVNDVPDSAASQDGQRFRGDNAQTLAQDISQQVLAKQDLVAANIRSNTPPLQETTKTPQRTVKSPIREINAKTSQTSLDGSIVRPATSAQKSRSSKKTKKASFAAETSFASSNGSIKSVLKVQKADMMDRAQKRTPPALSFSKSIDMNTSLEEGAKSPKHNSEVRKVPKGILRTRSTHSSPAAARASAMLSPLNREASSFSKMSSRDLRASGQNGVMQRQQAEEFDLEGALDDLGSFLSTWDAEKESLHAM